MRFIANSVNGDYLAAILSDLGVSSAGELIGAARPDEYPPRNNRVSRALYALGFDVERCGD